MKWLILSVLLFFSGDLQKYGYADPGESFEVERNLEQRHPWDREEFMRQRTVKVSMIDNGKTGWGAGVMLSKGRILTCAHVINGSPKRTVAVLLYGETKFVPARVVAVETIKDIAILQIEDKQPKPFVYLEPNFKYHEHLWLVGNPLGEDFEITETHISQINRFSYEGYKISILMYPCEKMTHGYSGGPTFNAEGSLIGLNEISVPAGNPIEQIVGPLLGHPPKEFCGSIPMREILQRFPFLNEN
jgi:S1-C subfamily serine protease